MISRFRAVLLIAAATALLTSVAHLTTTTVSREVFGVFSWMWWGRDQLWVTPLSYLALFSALGVLLAPLHALWPRFITLPRVAAAFMGLSALSVLLLFQRIAPWAWVVVALAIAVQSHRWLAGTDARVRALARSTALAFGAMTVLVGGGSFLRGAVAERRALAAIPDAPAGAPNVLLLILDTVRASDMSLYGFVPATTPALDARVRSGVVFDHAFSAAPWTLPSHATMFTGLYGSEHGADWGVPLTDGPATIAEVLSASGYATGGFVGNLHMAGFRTGLARGFLHYEDAKRSASEILFYNTTLTQTMAVETAREVWRRSRWLGGALRRIASFDLRPNGKYNSHEPKNAEEVASDFLRWQEGLDGRPFFAFLNMFDAHMPYHSPAPYDSQFEPVGEPLGRYRGGIRYMDRAMDSLFTVLAQRGVLENTIIVITSDHGEQFGEHNLVRHGNSLYLPLLHVPLMVLAPGRVTPGLRVTSRVSLRDLPATMLDLAGLAPNAGGIGGTSLAPLARGAGALQPSRVIAGVNRGINVEPRNPTAYGDIRAVLDDTLHVILDSRGRVEGYQHVIDPDERRNLARDDARRTALHRWASAALDSAGETWPVRAQGRQSSPARDP